MPNLHKPLHNQQKVSKKRFKSRKSLEIPSALLFQHKKSCKLTHWFKNPYIHTWKLKTLKATGRDLLDRQWLGRGEQRMHGDPVCTNSPWSPRNSWSKWSGTTKSEPPDIVPNIFYTPGFNSATQDVRFCGLDQILRTMTLIINPDRYVYM